MRSRGYGTAKRTSFQLYRMTHSDWWLLLFTITAAAVTVYGGVTGATEAVYTPAFSAAPITVFFPVYCIFLLIPTVIHVKEVLICRISISRI